MYLFEAYFGRYSNRNFVKIIAGLALLIISYYRLSTLYFQLPQQEKYTLYLLMGTGFVLLLKPLFGIVFRPKYFFSSSAEINLTDEHLEVNSNSQKVKINWKKISAIMKRKSFYSFYNKDYTLSIPFTSFSRNQIEFLDEIKKRDKK